MKLKLLLLYFFTSFGLQGAEAGAAAEEASPSLKKGLEDDGERKKQRKIDIADVEIVAIDEKNQDMCKQAKNVFSEGLKNKIIGKQEYEKHYDVLIHQLDEISTIGYVAINKTDNTVLSVVFLTAIEDIITIQFLVTHVKFRSQGIGGKIITFLKEQYAKKFKYLKVSILDAAKEFYVRNEFKETLEDRRIMYFNLK